MSLSTTRNRFGHKQATAGWTQNQQDSDSESIENIEEPEIMANASRDRTAEFAAILKSSKSSSKYKNGRVNQPQNNALKSRTEFSNLAKRVSSDLQQTFKKLEKLTILCKKRSLFDDKPVEIQELTYIIKQDISSLQRNLINLEQRRGNNQQGKDAQKHTNSIVKNLKSKLSGMSETFKSALEVRRENMLKQKKRKDEFSHAPTLSNHVPRGSSLLEKDEQRAMNSPQAYHNGGSTNGSFAISIDEQQPMYRNQELELVEMQDSYISERANTMQDIESTIVDLGNIMSSLSTMVQEQEEMVTRIDANVEASELNVELAHGEILQYFQSISSNRWLMIKVFGILIAFFVLFVVFFA